MYGYDQVKPWVGKELSKIEWDEDTFRLYLKDGGYLFFVVDADCCSCTWIEHVEAPEDLDGAILNGVEDSPSTYQETTIRYEDESVVNYKTLFRTSRGDIHVEFRNASNGYYGGSLEFNGFCEEH